MTNKYNTGEAYGAYDYNTGVTTYGATSGLLDHCHTGPKDVMEVGGAVIWAGSWSEMNDDLTWDLRIRLNDKFALLDGSPLIKADDTAKAMFAGHPEVLNISYPPTISIDWPDFGTPPMDKEWWEGLAKALADLPKDSNVAIYCQGGHGRTGTALSILASLSGNVPANTDPVYWVRRNYCEEAVESWAQIDYIQLITGEEITSLPTSQIKAQARQNAQTFKGWHRAPNGQWVENDKETIPVGVVQKITPKSEVAALAKGKA